MAFNFGNLIDQVSTAGRKYLPQNVNPFNIDYGVSELFNGGNNTQNTGQAPVNARILQNQPQQQKLSPKSSDTVVSSQEPVQSSGDPFGDALAALGNQQDDTGSSGSTAASTPHYVQYNGQTFDLNDPGQTLAYRQMVAQTLSKQRDDLLAQANDKYRIGSKDASDTLSRTLAQLDQQISDNQTSAKNFVTSHLKTVNQFNQDKNQGDVQRGQNFASLSPNAFQSSQGTSQQFANDQYLQGLGDLEKNASDTVGLDYLQDPNDPNKLGGQYGTQQQGINQGRGDVQNSYQNYLRDFQSGIADYTNQVNQGYTSGLDANANQLDNAGFQGNNPFSYNAQSYSPVKASSVELSKYTPYTTPGSLTSVPTSTAGGYKPVNTTNPFQNQSVTDQYLGRTNTTLDNGQSDYLKKYLLGK